MEKTSLDDIVSRNKNFDYNACNKVI